MNMTITAQPVQDAVRKLEESLLGAETQVFWAPVGAVVLTDTDVYEVYGYGEVAGKLSITVQRRAMERADGWEDVTDTI